MKITHIVPFFQPEAQRGTEKLVFNQNKLRNYDLEVITTNLNTKGEASFKIGKEFYDGIEVKRIRSTKIANQFIPISHGILKKVQCDILHIHQQGVIFCQIPQLVSRNIPTVLRPDVGKIFPNYNPLKILERANVDVITALNDRERSILKLMGYGDYKIRLIPYGVNYNLFKNFSKKIEPCYREVLMVARVIPIKNIELAIKAIANTKGFKLKVLGPIHDLSYYETLKKLCKELDVDKRVEFKGLIDYESLPKEYASSSLTLVTSIHESGGPASVFESLATGRPVISVPLEIVKTLRKYYAEDSSGGIIQVNYDAKEIAEKIEMLYNDKLYWKKLSQNGQKVVKKLSWERTLKEIDKIYKSLLE